MVKVLTACGNGMGSSMVIKMKVENALRQLGVSNIESASCSEKLKAWQLITTL